MLKVYAVKFYYAFGVEFATFKASDMAAVLAMVSKDTERSLGAYRIEVEVRTDG